MLQTNNKTAKQSQEWIMKALLDLMNEKNYHDITVVEICKKADLDRRTFYRNFDSKEDVLKQYITQLGDSYMNMFHHIDALNSKEAIRVFFTFWEKNLSFIKNVKDSGISDFLFQRFQSFIKEHKELFIGNVKEGLSSEFLFSYRIGGFWNVMLNWASQDKLIPPEEMVDILIREFE